MNARTLIAPIVLGALAVAACSDDTGILVEIHGETLDQRPVRIDTMVIIDGGLRPDSAMWGSADLQQAAVDVDVRQTPHTVMLQPDGVAADTAVWVAAMAYDGAGNVIAWGELDAPIAFEQDLVKRIAIELQPAGRLSPGCIVKGDVVVSRTDDDCDDDGFQFDVDCDDLDAQVEGDTDGDEVICDGDCDMTDGEIYPGAFERCDGIDSDCDPASVAPPIPCALVGTDVEGNVTECAIGQASCNDVGSDAGYGTCMQAVNLPKADHELCASWVDCDVTADPTCFADRYFACELPTGDAGACVPSIHELRDLAPDGAKQCNWRLAGNVQQLQWNVGLRARGNTGPLLSFVAPCDAEFVVQAAPANPTPRYFVVTSEVDGITTRHALLIRPKRKDCTGGPTELACVELTP
jgi:hypothetical protein